MPVRVAPRSLPFGTTAISSVPGRPNPSLPAASRPQATIASTTGASRATKASTSAAAPSCPTASRSRHPRHSAAAASCSCCAAMRTAYCASRAVNSSSALPTGTAGGHTTAKGGGSDLVRKNKCRVVSSHLI